MVSPNHSFAYGFLPDPEIYSQYSSHRIAISDEAGVVDLSVIRNVTDNITGIESLSKDKVQEYRSAFFADDINATTNMQIATVKNKYEQYSAYGTPTSYI